MTTKTLLLSFTGGDYLTTFHYDGAQTINVKLVQVSTGIRFVGAISNANNSTLSHVINGNPELRTGSDILLHSTAHQCDCRAERDTAAAELTQRLDCITWLLEQGERIIYVALDAPLTWVQSRDYAAARGMRLPKQAEIVATLRGLPVVAHDLWVAIMEKENEWVSVGNCEVTRRLGQTHTHVAGALPVWGTNNTPTIYRTYIALAKY